jgi:hypothetical protein
LSAWSALQSARKQGQNPTKTAYSAPEPEAQQGAREFFSIRCVWPSGIFSDGASYALSLGITNGDLFTHVLAFSLGLMAPAGRTGSPRIFVSHGVRDGVLPIDRCSRSIVPELKRGGYDVLYREFDGEHSISLEIALEAIGWFTQQKSPKGPVSAVPGADLLALRSQIRVALVK